MLTRPFFSVAASASVAAIALLSSDSHACGGCFSGGGAPTVVTAHRMALSVSKDRTVLWDQIQYQGDPAEFAWVLPVRPGATVQLGSDAFFEALDAATTTRVFQPQNATCSPPPDDTSWDDYNDGTDEDIPEPRYYGACSLAGCSAEGAGPGSDSNQGASGAGTGDPGWTGTDAPPDPPPVVEVVHEESIGPYEAVVLSSNQPGALYDWLLSHAYAVDETMEPVIDGYEAKGFDFVALRLIPGVSTRQMTPVRISSPGAAPVLPLKMVAAGAGVKVALTLFMIGEGRWEASSFANAEINTADLRWDFSTQSSNYSTLRSSALGKKGGGVWLTTYSKRGALLSPVYNPVAMTDTQYAASNGATATTIAHLYAAQGVSNGEITDMSCVNAFNGYAQSLDKVVDPCEAAPGLPGDGGSAGAAGGGAATTGGSAGAAGGGSAGSGGMGGGPPDGGGAGSAGGSPAEGGTGGAPAEGGAGGSPEEPPCTAEAQPGEIDARLLACEDLDDVAVALIGMRPVDVWLTRLDAELPKRMLNKDLALSASLSQVEVENWLYSSTYKGDPCTPGAVAPPGMSRPRPRKWPFDDRDAVICTVAIGTFVAAALRRFSKRRRGAPALPAAR